MSEQNNQNSSKKHNSSFLQIVVDSLTRLLTTVFTTYCSSP